MFIVFLHGQAQELVNLSSGFAGDVTLAGQDISHDIEAVISGLA